MTVTHMKMILPQYILVPIEDGQKILSALRNAETIDSYGDLNPRTLNTGYTQVELITDERLKIARKAALLGSPEADVEAVFKEQTRQLQEELRNDFFEPEPAEGLSDP